MIKKQNFYFKSSNKETRVHGICWIPQDVPVRAVLQIVHGMVEYVDRYDDFARFLCEQGIAVVGDDHLGTVIRWQLRRIGDILAMTVLRILLMMCVKLKTI